MFRSAPQFFSKTRFGALPLAASLALLLTLHAPVASAQAIGSSTDKLIPRVCTDRCIQYGEKVAVDAAGNAMAIWSEPIGGTDNDNILVSRYIAGTNTWSTPRVLDRQQSAGSPQIGLDGAGHAVAVWNYIFEGTSYFRYARFNAKTGAWSAPRTFMNDMYWQSPAQLEVSRSGNAFLHTVGRNDFGKSFRFDVLSNSWTTLESSTGNNSEIAADNAGNALMATGITYVINEIIATRYDKATKTVSRDTKLDEGSMSWNEVSGFKERAVKLIGASKSSGGGEMVLWERTDTVETPRSTTRTLRSAIFNRSTGAWQHLTIPKISNSETLYGNLEADRFGNVTAIWVQYVSGYAKTVVARYTASTGRWSWPKVISPGSFHTRDANLDVDANGNVIATWSQRTDTGTGSSVGKTFRTIAVRYAIGSNSWGQARTIQDANRNSYLPHMGVSDSGRAIILWQQDTGAFNSNGTPIKEMRADRLSPL